MVEIGDHVGNISILDGPKTAFLCSRRVPAGVILKCYDWAVEQRDKGRCILSGFHSTIEKDVLHYLLKGTQPIIITLHRGIGPELERTFATEIANGRLLIISPFKRSRTRGGAREATIRNQLMIDLAQEVVIGHAAPEGSIARLIPGQSKPISFIDGGTNGNRDKN